jgi:hypothetical protein
VECPGLSLLPKLKYEHVHLTAFSKMRVDLAAQVLSESVSKALRLTGGAEAEETAQLLSNIDKFFDCLQLYFRYKAKKAVPVSIPLWG